MIQSNGEQSLQRAIAAEELAAWLNATYGPDSWLDTPLGGWEHSLFNLDLSGGLPDNLEGWPPYSWDPLDDWLRWIEETKHCPGLHNDERRMRLLNALAVLKGQLAGTERIERIVAAAEASMLRARGAGTLDSTIAMLVDPPTPWGSMDEWLRFLESWLPYSPSEIAEEWLSESCKVVLTKIAVRRAAQLDPEITRKFWRHV